MYRLIIVEDETNIRKGMCKYIGWEKMGFEVVADFEDGKEAIEYLAKHPVEVVLTDIEMAEKTGLDIAEHIYRQQIKTKTVIISGYRDFEYARKAIEYNVKHYLLKPIQMQEVNSVFADIKVKLDHEALLNNNGSNQEDFELLLPELQEQFWISLLVGGPLSEKEIHKKLELLRLDINPQGSYAVIDISIKDVEEGNYYKTYDNKRNLINNIFQYDNEDIQYYIMLIWRNTIKVLATTKEIMSEEEFGTQLNRQIAEKMDNVQKLLKLRLDMKIEKIYENIYAFEQRKYAFQIHVMNANENIEIVEDDYNRLMQKYKLMVEVINSGNFKELDKLIDNIFFECRNLPLYQVKHLIINMFSVLSNKYIKMGNDVWKEINKRMMSNEILNVESKEVLLIKCRELLHDSLKLVSNKINESSMVVIRQAVEYMKKHYHENISLESIADRYFMNRSYFSRLFKLYTGETFTDCLIDIRMEEAKKLLVDGRYKVYEISQMVGYSSEKYFFRVFKQYTGKSPAEYQRSISLNVSE
jgi:two-component system, response regulator YesN